MEQTVGLALVLGFFLALLTENHWGPGVRNILIAIATRISGTAPVVEKGTRESSWMGRALRALVATAVVVGGVAASITIWEQFSG